MRQQSMRRKLLYLVRQPLLREWTWRSTVCRLSLDVAEEGILYSVMGFSPSHHPEPSGVEHAI